MAVDHAKKESHPSNKVSQVGNQETVSINQADAKELEKLPGIGVATAKRIVEYREKNGHFKSIQDLLQVRGISAHKLELMGKQVDL